MENIPLPSQINTTPGEKDNEAIINIQPCQPGYGITLGNALRRVLLSSLPGAAVTAFKINGIGHEFSTIPHVKEDIVEISLNLKQLRLKVFSDEPVKLELKIKGEKKVTGKDIKANSDVEIISTNLLIATLTDKEAELDMEIFVIQGRGYVPTEAKEKEGLETGTIVINSIFTPVKKVGFQIENVRVGKMTNYENLVLSIETDGTITPEEALNQATQILIDHFNFISDETKATKAEKKPKKETKVKKTKKPKKETKVKKEKVKKEEEPKEEEPKEEEPKEEEPKEEEPKEEEPKEEEPKEEKPIEDIETKEKEDEKAVKKEAKTKK